MTDTTALSHGGGRSLAQRSRRIVIVLKPVGVSQTVVYEILGFGSPADSPGCLAVRLITRLQINVLLLDRPTRF